MDVGLIITIRLKFMPHAISLQQAYNDWICRETQAR